ADEADAGLAVGEAEARGRRVAWIGRGSVDRRSRRPGGDDRPAPAHDRAVVPGGVAGLDLEAVAPVGEAGVALRAGARKEAAGIELAEDTDTRLAVGEGAA